MTLEPLPGVPPPPDELPLFLVPVEHAARVTGSRSGGAAIAPRLVCLEWTLAMSFLLRRSRVADPGTTGQPATVVQATTGTRRTNNSLMAIAATITAPMVTNCTLV